MKARLRVWNRILSGFKSSPVSIRIFTVIIRDIIDKITDYNNNNISLYCKFTVKFTANTGPYLVRATLLHGIQKKKEIKGKPMSTTVREHKVISKK